MDSQHNIYLFNNACFWVNTQRNGCLDQGIVLFENQSHSFTFKLGCKISFLFH